MREVVKINNEQEWEYVKEKINNPKGLLDFKRYEPTKGICINVRNGNYDYVDYYKIEGYIIISFEEFKSRYEPQLKIGDTFEKDGFVCEVKEKIKEPILVEDWIRNDRNMFFKYEKWMLDSPSWVKITDQEFINQLEKYSK